MLCCSIIHLNALTTETEMIDVSIPKLYKYFQGGIKLVCYMQISQINSKVALSFLKNFQIMGFCTFLIISVQKCDDSSHGL